MDSVSFSPDGRMVASGSFDRQGHKITYWPVEKRTVPGKDMFGKSVKMDSVGWLHLVGETPESCKETCAKVGEGVGWTKYLLSRFKPKNMQRVDLLTYQSKMDYKRHIGCTGDEGDAWKAQLASTEGLATFGKSISSDNTCHQEGVELGTLPEHAEGALRGVDVEST